MILILPNAFYSSKTRAINTPSSLSNILRRICRLKSLCKTAVFAVLLYSASAHSQLAGSDVGIWEKDNPAPRKTADSQDPNMLNFHHGIKGRLLKKYIKYSRNKSHTLSVVHAAREDEKIWENEEKKNSLSNNSYEKSFGKNVNI
ncbi:MAG TPA: hypothetical protein VFR70_11570, partial [Flavobacterium sp.]|nr:hypothetical protein [Flavobacterium sp.]